MKRTSDYVLFKVNGGTAIVNAKFIRQKESEDYIFLSVPPMYDISVRTREFIDGKWTTTKQYSVIALNLAPIVREYTKMYIANGGQDLPF